MFSICGSGIAMKCFVDWEKLPALIDADDTRPGHALLYLRESLLKCRILCSMIH